MLRYGTLVLVLALTAAGCASGGTGAPSAAVPLADVSAFAGHWSGWITSPSVSTRAITVIRPDGTFTGASPTAGAVDVTGTITVKDGQARYETQAGRPAGIFVVPRGTMVLSERGGKRVIDGVSDDGKVKFQLTSMD